MPPAWSDGSRPPAHRETRIDMTRDRSDLLQGTLEMLVLRVLEEQPMHGWGISQRLERMSGGVFAVNQGSLYPALQRMKRRGRIRSEWRLTDNNRRARYYELTKEGRAQLAREREQWRRASAAVNSILDWASELA
jgi:PadR family transcriptional regulator, regulatory protein PadR